MQTLLIALGAGVAFLIAYHTYGKWLGSKVFNLSAGFVCPSHRLNDGKDYVPSPKAIVFGHHFTSIAGTGPIVGPAIAVMWGWVPALLWVVFGSIFIGAVHDFGALVVSLRNNGQTVGDIAGRLLNKRVRLLFLFVLFMALTIVLAIFGLVIAAVFKQYPAAIFPCVIQIPIAASIGIWLHKKGVNLTIPSIIALGVMYLSVIYGNDGLLGDINGWMKDLSIMTWVVVLLVYSYIASVLPVWMLLQPRDYINSLQLLTALGLIVAGLFYAAFMGGAPPVEGAERQPLEIVAPAFDFEPAEAPMIFPFLFITIACGAISGFHCLVSSGTSSKQLEKEPDARFVGYGSMLTEGFLATIVILACVAGLGLGSQPTQVSNSMHLSGGVFADATVGWTYVGSDKQNYSVMQGKHYVDYREDRLFTVEQDSPEFVTPEIPLTEVSINVFSTDDGLLLHQGENGLIDQAMLTSGTAWATRYASWSSAQGLGAKVGAFVDGAANFLKSMGIPGGIAIALMGVLVASFAGTTLDTACRLQRYVVQELAATFLPTPGKHDTVPDRLFTTDTPRSGDAPTAKPQAGITANPLTWLRNKHGATLFAITIAALMAAMPPAGGAWTWAGAGKGGMILWPMFGATNQLLGGLAFLVIGFYLWRRNKPVWFLALPMVFMLVMPAWAMGWQLFVGSDDHPAWLYVDNPNWALIVIALATLALEAWMVVEAVLLWPKVKGIVEPQLAGAGGAVSGGSSGGPNSGMNC